MALHRRTQDSIASLFLSLSLPISISLSLSLSLCRPSVGAELLPSPLAQRAHDAPAPVLVPHPHGMGAAFSFVPRFHNLDQVQHFSTDDACLPVHRGTMYPHPSMMFRGPTPAAPTGVALAPPWWRPVSSLQKGPCLPILPQAPCYPSSRIDGPGSMKRIGTRCQLKGGAVP